MPDNDGTRRNTTDQGSRVTSGSRDPRTGHHGTRLARVRGPIGWAVYVTLSRTGWATLRIAATLPYRIAGPGEIERRQADRAWILGSPYAQPPADYERRPW